MTDDTYPNAGRDSGYIGEDLVNRLTVLVSGIETKLLLQGQRTHTDIAALVQTQDQRFTYILNQLATFLETEDQRHDNANDELSKITTALGGLKDGQTGLQSEFRNGLSRLQSTVSTLAETIDSHEQQIASMSSDISEIKDVLASRPEQRAAEHQAIVDEIGGRVDQFGHELAEFKIAFAVFNASLLLSENAVIVIDLTQIIVSVNQKTFKYFGYTADELIGQPLDMLIPERFRVAHRAHISAFAESGETQRLMADRHAVYGLHKDGTEFPIRAAIVKVPSGFTAVVERLGDGDRS